MLSSPVCGVDVKKLTVAPFEAPFLPKYNAIGTTPHEHSGNGTPITDAFTTATNELPPTCFNIKDFCTNACKIPINSIPIVR